MCSMKWCDSHVRKLHATIFLLKIFKPIPILKTQIKSSYKPIIKDDNMASHRQETDISPDIVPFFLNREDYVGFFLKTSPKEHNLTTFVLKRKDFNSQTEFMKNLAIIYDSFGK